MLSVGVVSRLQSRLRDEATGFQRAFEMRNASKNNERGSPCAHGNDGDSRTNASGLGRLGMPFLCRWCDRLHHQILHLRQPPEMLNGWFERRRLQIRCHAQTRSDILTLYCLCSDRSRVSIIWEQQETTESHTKYFSKNCVSTTEMPKELTKNLVVSVIYYWTGSFPGWTAPFRLGESYSLGSNSRCCEISSWWSERERDVSSVFAPDRLKRGKVQFK